MELHCNKLQKLFVSHEGMGNGHVVPLENGAGPSNGILTLSRPRAIAVQQAMASYKDAQFSAQQFTAQES